VAHGTRTNSGLPGNRELGKRYGAAVLTQSVSGLGPLGSARNASSLVPSFTESVPVTARSGRSRPVRAQHADGPAPAAH
jgi:hypothetical protein